MEPLHNNGDATFLLVIETTIKRVVVPLVHGRALSFRECLIWLERVIDHDKIRTSPGQHPSHRSSQSEASLGGDKFLYSLPLGRQACRKQPLVPITIHQ